MTNQPLWPGCRIEVPPAANTAGDASGGPPARKSGWGEGTGAEKVDGDPGASPELAAQVARLQAAISRVDCLQREFRHLQLQARAWGRRVERLCQDLTREGLADVAPDLPAIVRSILTAMERY